MVRFIFLSSLISLAACGVAPQKSLAPGAGYTDFRSALHLAGKTPSSRTLVYVVALDGHLDGFGLITHIARSDGRFPGITQAQMGGTLLNYQRISSVRSEGMMTESGLITLSPQIIEVASRTGMRLEFCGVGTCYDAEVPAGLFMQALVE